MNCVKKSVTTLLLLFLLVSVVCGIREASAANGVPRLTASLSGEYVVVVLETTEATNFGGLAGTWTYDATVFELISIQTYEKMDPTINATRNYAAADCIQNIDVPQGEAVFTWQYRIIGKLEEGMTYPFSFTFSEAWNNDFADYDWAEDTTIDTSLTIEKGNQPGLDPTPVVDPIPEDDPAPENDPVPEVPTPPSADTQPDPVLPETDPTDDEQKPGQVTTHTVSYKDKDGRILFVETIEDGDVLSEMDLPGADETWAVDGVEFDFSTPVEKDITLVATKTDELLEVAVLTVSLTAPEEQEMSFVLRFDGTEESETFTLKSGEQRDFRLPAGTAYELTVPGVDGLEVSAQVRSDGKQQDDLKSAAGADLVISSTLGAGENRVDVSGTQVAADREKPDSTHYLWLVAPAVLALAAAAAFSLFRHRRGQK